MKRYLLTLLITVLGVFMLAGCVTSTEVPGRPKKIQIENEQIRTSMRQLLENVVEIEGTVDPAISVNENSRIELMTKLMKMEELTSMLGAGQHVTNHPLLEENIHQLRADIVTARRAIELQPPNYYWVGRIAGSCTACHRDPR